MPSPTNLQAEWARIVVASLADAGVREAVVSPGSRSTPLVLALAAEPRIAVTDVIDERTGGFVALGMARVTGRPAVVVCTSGTAPAHYWPAVVEASEAAVPLVVLSADRPPEVQDAGANQTIRQPGLFGAFARWSVDLGAAEPSDTALRGARRRVLQAVHASVHDVPGPVHVNAPARKPLEPPASLGGDERDLAARVDAILARPPLVAGRRVAGADERTVEAWAEAVAAAAGAGLVACGPESAAGPAAREAALAFAAATGFPLLAEATSGLRFCGHVAPAIARVGGVDALLRAGFGTTAAVPRMVVQVGRPLVATGWERLAAATGVRWIVADHGWPDPVGTAAAVVEAEPAAFLAAVASRVAARAVAPDASHRRRWLEADAALARFADALVAEEGDALGEAAAVRELVRRLPDGALLMAGNSLPVRHLDAWVGPTATRLRVLSQRGASGIDGLVAGMAGAHRASGRPGALVLGDVSFVHDLSGLQALAAGGEPLAIVVLHNRGGRIFEQLPVAARAPGAMEHFLTEPRVSLGPVVEGFGLPFRSVDRVSAFGSALDEALGGHGPTVIEARVPPHGAAMAAQRLQAAAEALARESRG